MPVSCFNSGKWGRAAKALFRVIIVILDLDVLFCLLLLFSLNVLELSNESSTSLISILSTFYDGDINESIQE